jgi:hypothetical protein
LLSEAAAVELIRLASDAVDREMKEARDAMFVSDAGRRVYTAVVAGRSSGAPSTPAGPSAVPTTGTDDLPVRFFRLMKNLAADGYYTSRIGLIDELRYRGNTYLGTFPSCAQEM